MWLANQLVDLLAKEAAETVRLPVSTRLWLQERLTQLKDVAIFVGKLTYEAGAHQLANGGFARDSAPLSSRRPTGANRIRRVSAEQTQAVAAACSEVASVSVSELGTGSTHIQLPGCRAMSDQAPAAAARRRARQRDAMAADEKQRESTFQTWWCENRSQKVMQPSQSSGFDR